MKLRGPMKTHSYSPRSRIFCLAVLPMLLPTAFADLYPAVLDETPRCLIFSIRADASVDREHLAVQKKSVEKVKRKNPDVKYLTNIELDEIKGEKFVLGFIELSKQNSLDLPKIEKILRELLSTLDTNQYMLSSGIADDALSSLVFQVGHEMGFKTLGIPLYLVETTLPLRMDYFLRSENGWGKSAPLFLEGTDVIVTFGDSRKSNETFRKLQSLHKSVVSISEIKTSEKNKRVMTRGLAGTKARSEITETSRFPVPVESDSLESLISDRSYSKWLRRLPSHIHRIFPRDLRGVFPGKKLIGFSGWTVDGPMKIFVESIFENLDPDRHVIVTSGIDLAGEKIVHEVAMTGGFSIIAEVPHDISEVEEFFIGVTAVVPVARTWEGRNSGFINYIDALVSFGGGPSTVTQLTYAQARKLPFVHMKGNVAETDEQVPTKNSFTCGDRAARYLLKNFP